MYSSLISAFQDESSLPSTSAIATSPSAEGSASKASSADAVTDMASRALAAKKSEADRIESEINNSSNKLEALKSAVLARNAEKSASSEIEAVAKAKVSRVQRLRALPAFCDLLRMLFNRKRKTVLSTYECLRTLVAETTVGSEEYKWRLYLICEVVPDFISIVPPDDISPVEHIKVNIYCKYDECMKRLHAYIDSEA